MTAIFIPATDLVSSPLLAPGQILGKRRFLMAHGICPACPYEYWKSDVGDGIEVRQDCTHGD